MGREDGNVTIAALLFMGSLAMALILALEASCAYAQKTLCDNLLNIAREETFSAGFDMQLKSSDDPGELICEKLCSSLRANGYNGPIEMEFYEATEAEIERENPLLDSADNIRVIVYRTAIQRPYRNIAAPASWFSGVKLTSETTATMCPYSLHKTYRPEGIEGKLWRYSIDRNSSSAQVKEDNSQPNGSLAAELQEALKKPTEIYEANQ